MFLWPHSFICFLSCCIYNIFPTSRLFQSIKYYDIICQGLWVSLFSSLLHEPSQYESLFPLRRPSLTGRDAPIHEWFCKSSPFDGILSVNSNQSCRLTHPHKQKIWSLVAERRLLSSWQWSNHDPVIGSLKYWFNNAQLITRKVYWYRDDTAYVGLKKDRVSMTSRCANSWMVVFQ